MRKTTAKILEQVMPKTTRRKRAPIAAPVAETIAAPIAETITAPIVAPISETRLATPPTHEMIAARAYALFLARGGAHGYAHEDWARAERDLTRR